MSRSKNNEDKKNMNLLYYILAALVFIGVQVLVYFVYIIVVSKVLPRFEMVSYKYDVTEFTGTMIFAITFIVIWYIINIITTLILSMLANKFFDINVLFPILTWGTGLVSTGFTLYSSLMKSISDEVTNTKIKSEFTEHLADINIHIFISISIFVLTGLTTTLYKSYVDFKDKKKNAK